MKKIYLILPILGIILLTSCRNNDNKKSTTSVDIISDVSVTPSDENSTSEDTTTSTSTSTETSNNTSTSNTSKGNMSNGGEFSDTEESWIFIGW